MNDCGGLAAGEVIENEIAVLVNDIDARRCRRPMGGSERLGCARYQIFRSTLDRHSPQGWISRASRVVDVCAVMGLSGVDSAVDGYSLLGPPCRRHLPDIDHAVTVRGIVKPLAVARPRRHLIGRGAGCDLPWLSSVGRDQIDFGDFAGAGIESDLLAHRATSAECLPWDPENG